MREREGVKMQVLGLEAALMSDLKFRFSLCVLVKTSIIQHSACFMVQLSHPYMTVGKTIALTR